MRCLSQPNSKIAACLLVSALLGPAIARSQSFRTVAPAVSNPVITLEHGGAPQSLSYEPVKGEYSFAHGPANFYAFSSAKAGETAPLEAVTLRFSQPTTLTKIESASADFVVEDGGSCAPGNSYGKGDTCIVLMRFTPQGPGRRLGRLNVSHTASAIPASVGLGGNGYAPVLSFVPSRTYTVAPTYVSSKGVLSGAQNLTVDGGDVLYIADTGNTLLREIDSTGAMTSKTPVEAPESLAVDSFGLVYVLGPLESTDYFSYYEPNGGYTFYFTTYSPGTCTPGAPCNLGTVGMGEAAEINIDRYNNLFLVEETKGAMEAPVAGLVGEGLLPTINAWYLNDAFSYVSSPTSTFAVDGSDNLYTSYLYGSGVCYIVQEPLYGAEGSDPNYTRVAGANGCGYSGDGGQAADAEIGSAIGQIAFDAAGDLYFTDTNNQRVRMINATTGIISTVLGTGTKGFTDATGNRSTVISLSNPTGVAVDSQGQIYVITQAPSGAATQVVQKVETTGILNFNNQTQGTTSAPLILTVTNTGNSAMNLTNFAITGANTGDFLIESSATSCVLTAGASLNSGQTCNIGIQFKPSGTGVRSANLVFNNNTVTTQNIVNIYGTGTAPAPAFVPGSVSFPVTTPTQSNTMPVTITNKGNVDLQMANIALSGTNAGMFSFTSNCLGGFVAPGASCTLKVAFKPSSTGTYSATLNFTDNAPNSPQAVIVSGTGQKPFTSATKLSTAANPASACTAVTLHVAVSTSDGSAASGPVSLQVGGLTLASGTLTGGAATLTTQGLAPGLNLVTADYAGDTEHAGSVATLSQMVNRGSCGSFHPPLPAAAAPVHDAPIPDRP